MLSSIVSSYPISNAFYLIPERFNNVCRILIHTLAKIKWGS
jgi:hypothetical protein